MWRFLRGGVQAPHSTIPALRSNQVPRAMSRDLLLLLEPGFTDPRYPGERFICPDGAPIEGLLASDPARVARLDVRRVPFERPRETVVEALDEAHQGLPVLVLGDEQPA